MELRHVSLERLLISRLNADYDDAEARALRVSIERYLRAVKEFKRCGQLSLQCLKAANGQLWEKNKPFGIFRTTQNWIGDSASGPAYIPPKPELVEDLLASLFCNFENLLDIDLDALIYLYSSVLIIHPFCEGNGRTSRALMDSVLGTEKDIVHLDLYRLGVDQTQFINAIHGASKKNSRAQSNAYWDRAIDWCKNFSSEMESEELEKRNIISSKLLFQSLSDVEEEIVNTLWNQPIVTLSSLAMTLNSNFMLVNEGIKKLLKRKVLKILDPNIAEKQPLFICEEIMDFQKKLETKIFQNKN